MHIFPQFMVFLHVEELILIHPYCSAHSSICMDGKGDILAVYFQSKLKILRESLVTTHIQHVDSVPTILWGCECGVALFQNSFHVFTVSLGADPQRLQMANMLVKGWPSGYIVQFLLVHAMMIIQLEHIKFNLP